MEKLQVSDLDLTVGPRCRARPVSSDSDALFCLPASAAGSVDLICGKASLAPKAPAKLSA